MKSEPDLSAEHIEVVDVVVKIEAEEQILEVETDQGVVVEFMTCLISKRTTQTQSLDLTKPR